MNDAYLEFAELTECTNAKTLGDYLKVGDILEVGRGHQKFIEIDCDGAFTSGAEVASLYLRTGTTGPGDNDVIAILHDEAMSGKFQTAGTIAKVPIPSKNLSKYVSVYFYAETAVTAGGKLAARVAVY